ncbi:transporter, dicarboxylate/amino acid:cation Na+/H+ symporter family protein [Pyramidobacter piscolens W5455]|uniref:Transporter, dicarboxylate/amino acid:cation Na+/H+ symporter family protein n=3 Tax=Pyramidobacter piscolens TaxID=638849 RepID=A0ABP2HQ11_9BACT|nr:dicarboxylate/amino acid:cation symporter [Pyramidobacter piscolens]EFB89476.1 transporter, dicarboxylate/amino acid:cation Na+/H+ symporter family protein [Pyramidobacter piscolens W5455]
MAEKRGVSLIWQITIGFVAGILFGRMAAPNVVAYVDPLGKIFMALLSMLIVPLVLSSLVVGVASLGDLRSLGRIGVKTLALYLVTTAVAIAIGLVLANVIQPGAGMDIALAKATEAKAAPSLGEVLTNMFPRNAFASMVNANMLQIIVFALFLGVSMTLAGEKGKPALDFFNSLAETMYKMTSIVMKFAPYGVFALIAVTVSKYGAAVLLPFIKVIAAVYIGCIIHAVVVYSGMVMAFARKSPLWFFKGIKEASLTAFVTRSSSGTLPVTMECCHNMGVPDKVASFVLPLGATINMDGTALYQGVCALFIAQAFGIPLSVGTQLGIIVTATLGSIGTAGVPGGGLIMLTLVTTQAGLPLEGVAMIAGIDAVLDMVRTSLNITGDAAVATVVAKSEGAEL